MEISKEMMDRWVELVSAKLTSEENLKMADDYETLARRYDDFAKEARTRAEAHRRLANS